LLLIALANLLALASALGQTIPAQIHQFQNLPEDKQVLAPSGTQTQNTVPNAYDDAIGNLLAINQAVPVNQTRISNGVRNILTGNYSPLVFQAAEQGQGSLVQRAANNVLNAGFGSVNDTYRGMHQWFADDCVQNLFPNIGQLIAKWIGEFMDGWIADAAQCLSKMLRVFVLNPNIAVNGLNGQQDDGISRYIRQGADIMYSIAIDLLLLLFILCIWKFWADGSWHGRSSLMGAVGRLIFTAGLLIAWPTLYAFDIQISNEMIRAIYFNNTEQVQMLDFALAQAVRGGLLAAGNGAISILAPVAGKLAMSTPGKYLGEVFSFGSTLIYVILGSMLIAELVYMLVLKAIQTALITAQYLFAPVFLVCFATPDTESYATGYVKAFVETSLWTFVWVGLLKVMTIILFSDFNPWGKILISVGVLQLMIQVPSFLGRAQISPLSEFVTPKLIFNAINKALSGLGMGITGALDDNVGWFTSGRFEGRGLELSKDAALSRLPAQTTNPELLNSLNNATHRNIDKPPTAAGFGRNEGSRLPSLAVRNSIGLGKSAVGLGSISTDPGKSTAGLGSISTDPGKSTAGLGSISTDPNSNGTSIGSAGAGTHNKKPDTGDQASSFAGNTEPVSQAAPAESIDLATNEEGLRYLWSRSTAQGWDSANLLHVDARKLLSRLTGVEGIGLRLGQPGNSVMGSTSSGVERVNIAEGASAAEMTHGIYAAAFAHNIAGDDPARDAARRAAIRAANQSPRGLLENLCANWLNASGNSWNQTAIAKERFQQSMFEEAISGSLAYVSAKPGNAYTDYLRGRYGDWGPDQDAEAVHLVSNPDSSESPWNRNIGPATDCLIASGIPIDKDTRGAMQNQAIQSMHPSRRKQAVFATLSYTYPQAMARWGHEQPSVFKLAHGEMARSLPQEVNEALAMYQITDQDDLCTSMAPQFMHATSTFASSAQMDFGTAYRALLTEAPCTAQRLGYLGDGVSPAGIHSFSDLAALVAARQTGESRSILMNVIFHEASNTLISRNFQR
jgi:hypothetical protein